MRKLSILLLVFAALILLSTEAFAQEVKDKAQKELQNKVQRVTKNKVVVQISDLPEVVTVSLNKKFAGFVAKGAYKTKHKNKEVYYVKLVSKEKDIKVLIDAEGNFLEKNDAEQK